MFTLPTPPPLSYTNTHISVGMADAVGHGDECRAVTESESSTTHLRHGRERDTHAPHTVISGTGGKGRKEAGEHKIDLQRAHDRTPIQHKIDLQRAQDRLAIEHKIDFRSFLAILAKTHVFIPLDENGVGATGPPPHGEASRTAEQSLSPPQHQPHAPQRPLPHTSPLGEIGKKEIQNIYDRYILQQASSTNPSMGRDHAIDQKGLEHICQDISSHVSISLPTSLSLFHIHLSACLSAYLSVCHIYLSVYLSIYLKT